jgi:hypothetical protein
MGSSRMLFVAFVALLGGCAKTPSNSPPGASAQPPNTPAVSKSACDLKLIAASDVADLFSEPVVKAENIPGDPQSCKFKTAGFSAVTISLRPGHGVATVGTYTSGHMNEFEKSEPLPGVGDEAVRSLDLNRVVARKGDLLCEITGPGLAPPAGDPMISRLGRLCNGIFAAQAH